MPFLDDLAETLLSTHGRDLREVAVVLPDRLAGVHLREALARANRGPLWSPRLYHVHGFLSAFTGLHALEELDALLLLHRVHHDLLGPAADDLVTFLQWAPTALRDMDEVDNHLVDTDHLYRDLALMEEIDEWSFRMGGTLSPGQQRLAKHWAHQGALHAAFRTAMLANRQGTRGITARYAAEKADALIASDPWSHVWFAGSDAPTPALREVTRAWLQCGRGHLLWDADRYYLDDPHNEAGRWIRAGMDALGPGSRPIGDRVASQPPAITVVAAPHAVAAIQVALGLLARTDEALREHTTVVLADRSLLPTLLELWPEVLGPVNITLDIPLRELPVHDLLKAFFGALRKFDGVRGYPVETLLPLLRHPCWEEAPWMPRLITSLVHHPHGWITPSELFDDNPDTGATALDQLFHAFADTNRPPTDRARALIAAAAAVATGSFLREQLYHAALAIARTGRMEVATDPSIDDQARLLILERVLHHVRLHLLGDPLEGIRIMGLDAAGAIDTERIIVLGANEGILPPTDAIQTFIPFPVRRSVGLPSNEERDAMVAYPFHRLLHRCGELVLCHFRDPGGEGEPSRYIHQLEREFAPRTGRSLRHEAISLPLPARPLISPLTIPRTEAVLHRYRDRYTRGMGPTVLGDQLYCPLDHYFKHVLRLEASEPPSSGLRPNEMGTLVHNALEAIHKPHLGRHLNVEDLRQAIAELPGTLRIAARKLDRQADVSQGKAMLQLAMAQRALERHLAERSRGLEGGRSWRVLALEAPFDEVLKVDTTLGPVDLHIRGRMDRVDELDGQIQVIDLKTGAVVARELDLPDPMAILEVKDPRKPLQLLLYAWAYLRAHPQRSGVEAAIIPLRQADAARGVPLRIAGDTVVRREWLPEIEKLIAHIVEQGLDPSTPIAHRPTASHCVFCG